MAVYLAILIVLALLGFMAGARPHTSRYSGKGESISSSVLALTLILLLAFRAHHIGTDVKHYLEYWAIAETRDLSNVSRFEPAFVALVEATHWLSDSPQFFLTAVAVLSIAPIAYAIQGLSPRPILSWAIYVCLGFYAFTFSGLRQAIAYGFTTAAIHFIKKKQPLLFLILVIVASSFHISALIFLPAYWVYRMRLGPIGLTLYFSSVLVIFIFRAPIFLWVTENFFSDYELSRSNSYSWLLLSACIVLLSWLQLSQASKQQVPDHENRNEVATAAGLLRLATVGVTMMMFASVGNNVLRLADYYYVAIIFLIPMVLSTIPTRTRIIVHYGLACSLGGIYVVELLGSPYSIMPYSAFTD